MFPFDFLSQSPVLLCLHCHCLYSFCCLSCFACVPLCVRLCELMYRTILMDNRLAYLLACLYVSVFKRVCFLNSASVCAYAFVCVCLWVCVCVWVCVIVILNYVWLRVWLRVSVLACFYNCCVCLRIYLCMLMWFRYVHTEVPFIFWPFMNICEKINACFGNYLCAYVCTFVFCICMSKTHVFRASYIDKHVYIQKYSSDRVGTHTRKHYAENIPT